MAPISLFRHCLCFRPREEEVKQLDYSHCCLDDVPNNVFSHERTLEDLCLDANQIKDLPRALFHCEGLRKLGLSDNELQSIPAAISSLGKLEELNISRNHILQIPDSIKQCKCLQTVEASVNPLGPRLPDGFTQLINLQELYLNDTFLEYLPANFGRLARLQVVEMRENHLKALPKSMSRLVELRRLDIGHNDFFEFPEVIGSLPKLSELWCDNNRIVSISETIGNLKQLVYFDISNNRLEEVASEIGNCESLMDLTLSSNNLTELPETIGNLKNLNIIRCDDNEIKSLPSSIGSCSLLEEFVFSENEIEIIPQSIGFLRNLNTLIGDSNKIKELPTSIGSCLQLRILSLADNQLKHIPDEISRLSTLKVLNLNANLIQHLPFSMTKLTQLQALWLSQNQNKPLIPLQSDIDPNSGQKILTCFLLPQLPREETSSPANNLSPRNDQSPHGKSVIKFSDTSKPFGDDEDSQLPSRLIRAPTPYPKELKAHARHARNLALKQKDVKLLTQNNASEETENKIGSETLQVNEDGSVLKDSKPSQFEIKEAKVSRAPLSQLDRSKSVDCEVAERPSSLPIKSSISGTSLEAKSIEMKDLQTSNLELVASKLSQLLINETDSNEADMRRSSHERKGSYKSAVTKTSILKSPIEKKLKQKLNDEHERGYRSDHELYTKESLKHELNLGYSSDLESKSIGYEKLKPSQPETYQVEDDNKNFKEISVEKETKKISEQTTIKAEVLQTSTHNSVEVNENQKILQPVLKESQNGVKSDVLSVQSNTTATDGFSTCSINSLYPSSGSALSLSSRPSSFSSTSQHSLITSESAQNNQQPPALPPKPINSIPNRSSLSQPGIPLAPQQSTNRLRYPMSASSEFIIHRFSHDSQTSFRNSVSSNKSQKDSIKQWENEAINFFDNSDELFSSNSSLPLLTNQPKILSNRWLLNTNSNSHVFPVIIVKNPDLGFSFESGCSFNNNALSLTDNKGIFVSDVVDDGPACTALKVGDKILQVDGIDLQYSTKEKAFDVFQSTGTTISLVVSREKT